MMILMDQEPQGTGNFDSGNWQYETLDVTEQFRAPEPVVPPPKKRRFTMRALLRGALILAVCSLVLSIVIGAYVVLRKQEKKPSTPVVINTQNLDNGTLNQLTTATGDNKQQLTIFPDTLFKNSVEVQHSTTLQSDLTVAGQTNLKGPVTLQQSLAVGGNLTVTGSISGASLSVGNLTISSVSVSSDVAFGGHLVPNGGPPTVKASLAASGGSVTVSGNDTSGTITINIGNGALQSGEMAIITFNKPFNTTPKVQLTPVTLSASNLRYYATRSVRFFTINTGNAPLADTSYSFDYFVTQ